MVTTQYNNVATVPFVLARADWLQLVMGWLDWSLRQINAADPASGDDAEKVEAFKARAVEELTELLRIGKIAQASSPLVFMRQVPPLDAETIPMPPRSEGERGN